MNNADFWKSINEVIADGGHPSRVFDCKITHFIWITYIFMYLYIRKETTFLS
jgi:hypothetical protein